MKRVLFLVTIVLFVFSGNAQKYEDIKNQLVFNKFKEARVELDKAMTNAKFTSKAEAYILKTAIYAGLSMADAVKNTPAGDQFASEADAAFKKYMEMDPALLLVTDLIYQNGPINLYSNYYTSGYTDYTVKKWQTAYDKLKKAVEYSDFLITHKLLQTALDTNVLILAGITAENSNNKEDAVKYYSRLADNKVTGEGFESVYRYLVSHYFGKKDITSFEKYKALGKELFPKSEYFNFDKVDFAVGLQDNLADKVKAVEEVLATDPDNFKANEVLGEIIFEALNPRDDSVAIPANAADLETKMINAFNKAAAAKPGFEVPYLYMGDHFINQAVKVDDERTKLAADIKARTKPGTMSSKEDVAKRDALDKKYGEVLEKSKEPYEKACAIFAAKPKLELKDKAQYKKAASYLADVFAFKKIQAKGKAAEQAKYAAEEKKWNDLWDSIK